MLEELETCTLSKEQMKHLQHDYACEITCAQTQTTLTITSACKIKNLNVVRIHEAFKNEKQVLVFVLFMRNECKISITISQILSHLMLPKLSANMLLCVVVFFFPPVLKEILGNNKTLRAIAGFYFFIYIKVYRILSRQTSFWCK